MHVGYGIILIMDGWEMPNQTLMCLKSPRKERLECEVAVALLRWNVL